MNSTLAKGIHFNNIGKRVDLNSVFVYRNVRQTVKTYLIFLYENKHCPIKC